MRGARAPRAPRRCIGRWLDSLRRVRFEKWQALGNDYAIVEERELPFELTPERIRRFCAPHTGVGSDGILLIRETEERGFVAEIRIYNPDGSEAELSGNGVRQAVMYLRRSGWTEHDSFSVRTVAGEVRPRIDGELCTLDIGRARLRAPDDFPSGADDGTGTLSAGGREFDFQFVQVGNPQCSIELGGGLEELDLALHGPEIERHELFPRRTNVSFWRRSGDASIRVRIFERGVGETMSSGTGASGAAVAAVLRGVGSPVTVELDGGELVVDVGEDMHVDLTGWARPVYAGVMSDEFVKELDEAQ
jgi:diaminopimelate epimerase